MQIRFPKKRTLVALVLALVVFGAVWAFAAGLSVTSGSLGAGSSTVAACNATATVSYNVTYSSSLPGYKVTTAPITSAAGCNGLSYQVTLTGSGNASLGEVTGTLNASGAASPDFTSSNVPAVSVIGVQLVITG